MVSLKKLQFIIAVTTFLLATLSLAEARPIISGISTNQINIDTNFTGTEILLFGAKGDSGDIIIAIRGPKKDFLVSKKKQTLGIWHNGQRVKFKDSYSYYSIFSTFNKIDHQDPSFGQLELGEDNLQLNIKADYGVENTDEFSSKLIKKLEKEGLYSKGAQKIDFLDETLFKITLDFPKNISKGAYTAEIYLIDDSNLVAFQSIPIFVNQVGLTAKIDDLARNNSALYGLIAILIAVIAGFIANYAFARFTSH